MNRQPMTAYPRDILDYVKMNGKVAIPSNLIDDDSAHQMSKMVQRERASG